MGNYSKYKNFIEHGVYQDANLDRLTDQYNIQYQNSISSFNVLINSDRANNVYRNGVLYRAIVDYGNQLKKSEVSNANFRLHREIRTRCEDNFRGGDVIEFENTYSKTLETFLLIKTTETKEGYDLSVMQKCNHNLKWQRNCKVYEYPTVVFSRTAYKDDVYPDKVMTLASGQFQLYIQDTEETRDLQISNRFFIGRDVYEIAYIDDVTLSGLLILTLNKSMSKNDRDNVELGIADYKDCDNNEHITDVTTKSSQTSKKGGLW